LSNTGYKSLLLLNCKLVRKNHSILAWAGVGLLGWPHSQLGAPLLVIGLTGGIGTGKTEVARVLRKLGAVVIESDKVAHFSYLPRTEAHKAIVSIFGDAVLDKSGWVDRKSLGKIVFSNKARRVELEEIVWPAARTWIEARLAEEEKQESRVVVIEVPKLYEAGWDRIMDVVWTVEAPEGEIKRRLEQRPGFSEADANARVAAQITRAERVDKADRVIENNTTLDDLRNQITEIWESIPATRDMPDKADSSPK
jgi:dephospho-CoA kinase